MANAIVIEDQLEIPLDLRSLAEFRRWATSDAFPERGRIDYLQGRIEVDRSPEDLHRHGKLKAEVGSVLAVRVKRLELGELYIDRARVSSPQADLSVEPDVLFISEDSLNSGRVQLVPRASGAADGYIEMEGAPDLVVEIVSDSSVAKDTRRLPPAYFRAGVAEFWLLDARGEELIFHIHRRGPTAYEPAPVATDGAQHSAVLGCWYRLTRSRNRSGRVTYTLDERPD